MAVWVGTALLRVWHSELSLTSTRTYCTTSAVDVCDVVSTVSSFTTGERVSRSQAQKTWTMNILIIILLSIFCHIKTTNSIWVKFPGKIWDCTVVYGNVRINKDGGREQEQVFQPISARQDCSGGNGTRAGVARCASYTSQIKATLSIFTMSFAEHMKILTLEGRQKLDVQHTHSKAMPNLILCCLGLIAWPRRYSQMFSCTSIIYKTTQPWTKWLVSPYGLADQTVIVSRNHSHEINSHEINSPEINSNFLAINS